MRPRSNGGGQTRSARLRHARGCGACMRPSGMTGGAVTHAASSHDAFSRDAAAARAALRRRWKQLTPPPPTRVAAAALRPAAAAAAAKAAHRSFHIVRNGAKPVYFLHSADTPTMNAQPSTTTRTSTARRARKAAARSRSASASAWAARRRTDAGVRGCPTSRCCGAGVRAAGCERAGLAPAQHNIAAPRTAQRAVVVHGSPPSRAARIGVKPQLHRVDRRERRRRRGCGARART